MNKTMRSKSLLVWFTSGALVLVSCIFMLHTALSQDKDEPKNPSVLVPHETIVDEKDKNKALGGNPPGGCGSLDKVGRGPADSTPPNGDLLKGDDFQSSTEPTATEEPFASETTDNFFNPDNFTAPEPIATTSPGQTDLQQQTVGSQTSVTGTAPGTGPTTTLVTTQINSS